MKQLRYLWMDLRLYAMRIKKNRWFWALLMPLVYPQTWANVQYRLQKATYEGCRIPLVRQLLLLFFFVNGRVVKMLTGIEVHHTADCGPGLYFAHLGSIIIGMGSRMGHCCSVHHEVTLGGAGIDTEKYGFPTVGNGVYLAAGVKVIGGVKIGNDVMVGANAVVTKDIPSHAVAVGIPARIIKQGQDAGAMRALVVYPGLKVDGDMEGK